jgi:hypothetical protein
MRFGAVQQITVAPPEPYFLALSADPVGSVDAFETPGGAGYYTAGTFDTIETRNWLRFDTSGIAGTILSATLTVPISATGYFAVEDPDMGATYTLSLFVGNATALLAGTPDAGTFTALGSGTVVGSTSINAGSAGGSVTIPLNADAIAALNAGSVILGGKITAGDECFIFGDPESAPTLELLVQD